MYLGDALDHWKGSIFAELQTTDILRDFAVDPMVGDAASWKATDWSLLSKLLKVQQQQILSHGLTLDDDRCAYFKEVTHTGDLFLDPDTGIATGRVKNPTQYLFPAEIFQLLDAHEPRLLVVYQHIRAQKTRTRLEKIISVLRHHSSEFACCSYESSTVAMLFLSRDVQRVKHVSEYFQKMLGRHSANRISFWDVPVL